MQGVLQVCAKLPASCLCMLLFIKVVCDSITVEMKYLDTIKHETICQITVGHDMQGLHFLIRRPYCIYHPHRTHKAKSTTVTLIIQSYNHYFSIQNILKKKKIYMCADPLLLGSFLASFLGSGRPFISSPPFTAPLPHPSLLLLSGSSSLLLATLPIVSCMQ